MFLLWFFFKKFLMHWSLVLYKGIEKVWGCFYLAISLSGVFLLKYNKNRLCSLTCGIDKIYKIESRKSF